MKPNKKFVYTQDVHVAEQLKKAGFVEIPSASGFVFINDSSRKPMTFGDVDLTRVVFTDHLCL